MGAPTGSGIGVAMSVHNGARFLEEQLKSIADQDLVPEHLVVHDDGSTDGSVSIVQRFAREALFPVSLVRRRTQPPRDRKTRIALGFEAAAKRLDTPLVAFADQDDRWLPRRLSATREALLSDSQKLLAFGDAETMTESGSAAYGNMSKFFPAPPGVESMAPHDVVRHLLTTPFILGTTMTVRASLLSVAQPIPPYWLHDRWLGLVAAAMGGLVAVPETLVRYRLHPDQQVGLSPTATANRSTAGRLGSRAVSVPVALSKYRALSQRLRALPNVSSAVPLRPLEAIGLAVATSRARLPER